MDEYSVSELIELPTNILEEIHDRIMEFDKLALDDEAVVQARLTSLWTTVQARLKKISAKAKKNLTTVEGRKGLEVRKDYKNYGFEFKADLKEKPIQAIVDGMPEVEKAFDAYLEAEHRKDVVSGIVSSLEQRKTMIRLAGDLWIKEYYAKDSFSTSNMGNVVEETDMLRERMAYFKHGKSRRR